MRLPNEELYSYFIDTGVTHLYHANSVATAMTFISANGLLSRGAVEERQLFQTSQSSDERDKLVDVWNDIFLDTRDLHGYFPRENIYGPVSFKFSVDLILDEDYEIWITKNNPQYWNEQTPMVERYFQSIHELRSTAGQYLIYRMMVLIKNVKDPLSFDHLIRISIDEPRVIIYNEFVLSREYTKAFRTIQPQHLVGRFRLRRPGIDCLPHCYCTDNYLRYPVRKLTKLFLPQDHPRFNG